MTQHEKTSQTVQKHFYTLSFSRVPTGCTKLRRAVPCLNKQHRTVQNCTFKLKKEKLLFVNAQASSPFCARTWKMWKWRITLLISVNFHSNQVRTNERFPLMYRQQLDHVRVCLRWRSTAWISNYTQCTVPHCALTGSNKPCRVASGNPAFHSFFKVEFDIDHFVLGEHQER